MPFTLLALVVAIATAAGSLYLTLEMGQKACTLCLYQRAYAFALVGVLAAGLLAFRDRAARVCLLGLPVALAGLGVSGFAAYLGAADWPRQNENWYLACPMGIEAYGTTSQQAFAMFGAAVVLLLIGAVAEVKVSGHGGIALLVALALGAAAGYGSIIANPPLEAAMPAVPGALTECRPTLK